MKITRLTNEEIQTLQVDAALRLIGELTNSLADLNQETGEAIVAKGKAEIVLAGLRNDKQTIIEMLRSLKVIASSA